MLEEKYLRNFLLTLRTGLYGDFAPFQRLAASNYKKFNKLIFCQFAVLIACEVRRHTIISRKNCYDRITIVEECLTVASCKTHIFRIVTFGRLEQHETQKFYFLSIFSNDVIERESTCHPTWEYMGQMDTEVSGQLNYKCPLLKQKRRKKIQIHKCSTRVICQYQIK